MSSNQTGTSFVSRIFNGIGRFFGNGCCVRDRESKREGKREIETRKEKENEEPSEKTKDVVFQMGFGASPSHSGNQVEFFDCFEGQALTVHEYFEKKAAPETKGESELSVTRYQDDDPGNKKNSGEYSELSDSEEDKPIKKQIKKKKTRPWIKKDDDLLVSLVEKYNGKHWRDIAKCFKGRSVPECQARHKKLVPQTDNKRKPWNKEDDDKLLGLIEVHGKDWAKIAEEIPGKSGKQVRERYLNTLDPTINKEKWSKQEDKIILTMYYQIGSKWSDISKMLNNRPENMVKNRFYTHLQKEAIEETSEKAENDEEEGPFEAKSSSSETHQEGLDVFNGKNENGDHHEEVYQYNEELLEKGETIRLEKDISAFYKAGIADHSSKEGTSDKQSTNSTPLRNQEEERHHIPEDSMDEEEQNDQYGSGDARQSAGDVREPGGDEQMGEEVFDELHFSEERFENEKAEEFSEGNMEKKSHPKIEKEKFRRILTMSDMPGSCEDISNFLNMENDQRPNERISLQELNDRIDQAKRVLSFQINEGHLGDAVEITKSKILIDVLTAKKESHENHLEKQN